MVFEILIFQGFGIKLPNFGLYTAPGAMVSTFIKSLHIIILIYQNLMPFYGMYAWCGKILEIFFWGFCTKWLHIAPNSASSSMVST